MPLLTISLVGNVSVAPVYKFKMNIGLKTIFVKENTEIDSELRVPAHCRFAQHADGDIYPGRPTATALTPPRSRIFPDLSGVEASERIAERSVMRRFIAFARDVSIVGLYFLTLPSSSSLLSCLRKTVWTSLLLFGVGFMLYQIQERVSFYNSRPTSAVVEIVSTGSLRFPSVTICNENRVSRAASQKIGEQ